MRIGIFAGLNGPITFEHALAGAQEAERYGFASYWLPNIFGLDALTALAGIGPQTQRIELGTNVVPVQPRHPLALAQQALSTSVLAGGRLTLGLGLSHRFVIERVYGLSFEKPARYMEEYLSVLNPLLAGDAVRVKGELFRINAQLTVADATPPPVLLAAMGPRMLKLAGAMTAGTFLGWAGPKNVREHAAPLITAAAEAAGRPAPRIGTALPVCVTDDAESARLLAGELFAVYNEAPSYRTILDREGKATVADAGLIGPEQTVLAGLNELAAAGVTDFGAAVFSATSEDRARTFELLASAGG